MSYRMCCENGYEPSSLSKNLNQCGSFRTICTVNDIFLGGRRGRGWDKGETQGSCLYYIIYNYREYAAVGQIKHLEKPSPI